MPAYRRRLQAIPTSLTVSDADVDLLVAEGKTMVQNDPTLLGLIARTWMQNPHSRQHRPAAKPRRRVAAR